MGLPKSGDAASRFSAYVEGLASVIGHADRAKPLRDYCVGLMMPRERKSVEPMAAITARKITWREATAEPLSSRFARVRVRAAHRDYWLAESRPEEWLLIEWPEGEEAPTKYWFSTLPATIAFHQLVDTAKLRWRIERDYQELKQEVGLGHFEGRGWRGFHHHATLCIAAYGFLVSERETIPPSGARFTRLFKEITIPETYRPRGSALAA